jgi:DnaJ-class molecular chaperone
MEDIRDEIKCSHCAGDGLEMCRVDGCDYSRERKCHECKGSGITIPAKSESYGNRSV